VGNRRGAAQPRAYAEIVAPTDGIVQIEAGENIALPGSAVQRGDILATIAPPVLGDSWVESRLAYEQARRDYERAGRLRERDAISQREYEETRNEYEARRAGFEGHEGAGTVALALKAPINGKIIEWTARPGQMVRAGDRLMAVADPSVVWLKVNVYENDYRSLAQPVGAHLNPGAPDGGLILNHEDIRVLTTGGALDPATRTIPVLLEVANTSGRLTIHESTPVELCSSDGGSALAVPKTAVYEDGGLRVVFVQTGGESFEKRLVRTGPRHAGWVSILEGLQPGDRIVTVGGYHVKLASTSAEIGHGHAH
jgi:RND family efflux transporter MFP subunit